MADRKDVVQGTLDLLVPRIIAAFARQWRLVVGQRAYAGCVAATSVANTLLISDAELRST